MLPQLSTLYFAARQVVRKRGNTRNNLFQLAMQQAARQVEEKCCPNYLRWLKTVSSTFQDLDFDGS